MAYVSTCVFQCSSLVNNTVFAGFGNIFVRAISFQISAIGHQLQLTSGVPTNSKFELQRSRELKKSYPVALSIRKTKSTTPLKTYAESFRKANEFSRVQGGEKRIIIIKAGICKPIFFIIFFSFAPTPPMGEVISKEWSRNGVRDTLPAEEKMNNFEKNRGKEAQLKCK